MPKPCSEAGCPNPSRARGLCQSHYAVRWKASDLPPRTRVFKVKHKVSFTREQSKVLRELARQRSVALSELLRQVVSEFIEREVPSETA